MHRPQKNVGSLEGEGQDAHHKRQKQQHRIGRIEPEDDRSVCDESNNKDRRDRQADVRQRCPKRQIDRSLKLIGQRRPDGGQGLGSQYQYRHKKTPSAHGVPKTLIA
jgi:hypothetical protein